MTANSILKPVRWPRVLLALAVVAGLLGIAQPAQGSTATDLFFSEYIEGSSNNKALEIYNATGASVNLATGGYSVQMFFNGSASAGLTINLTGTVADGDVFVLAQSSAIAAILAQADQTNGAGWFNGDDAVALRKGTTILDVIGQVGVDPGIEWGSGLTSTADNTLRRKSSVSGGDPTGSDAFDPSLEWDGFATDTFDGLGTYGGTTATVTPVPPTNTPTPAPPTNTPTPSTPCLATDTPIGNIQSAGAVFDPAFGGMQTVQGVVVGDYEGASPALRGFYLQDTGDTNLATSDGIFVFESNNANQVNLGDVVQVTGSVGENQGQTQMSTGVVEKCGTTDTVTPVDVSLPFSSADAAERYEGMLVKLPQTLYVTEHFQLGRFGQVVMSSGERLRQPTNVTTPGMAAQTLQAENNLNRIIIDDALNNQNPDPILFGRSGNQLTASNTLRGGDTATGIVGVMTYTWAGNSASGNAYRVRPINALGSGVPNFQPANPRPSEPPVVGGRVKVASFNVLNYFLSIDTTSSDSTGACGPSQSQDCRGADSSTELQRQRAKTLSALQALNADIYGLIELENTPGVEPLQDLVDGLNATAGANTFAYINTGIIGSDAIKVGIIYRNGTVTPIGQFEILDSTDDPNFIDTKNRPSLAQTFEETGTGARFTVVVNHLKSKGSDCNDVGDPDTGDGQGNCNQTRQKAAQALVNWLASDPTDSDDPDFLIIGDLNSYAKEDPITTIEGAGYTNLIELFNGEDAYSYAFDGQWGYLDHALSSPGLTSQVSGVADYHINADEPAVLDYNTEFKNTNQQSLLYAPDQFRVSDHDPVLIGLNLNRPPSVSILNLPLMVNEGGSLNLQASGTDPDGDTLAYAWDLDADSQFDDASGASATFSAANLSAPSTQTVIVQVQDTFGNSATAEAAIAIIYNFTGFFQPVDNLPTFNTVKAGSSIPVKFSLGGDQGLAIFADGYPKSQTIACNSGAPSDEVEETTSASSGLTYDPASGQYTYTWKTDKPWAGTCRQLVVKLNDTTEYRANFTFK